MGLRIPLLPELSFWYAGGDFVFMRSPLPLFSGLIYIKCNNVCSWHLCVCQASIFAPNPQLDIASRNKLGTLTSGNKLDEASFCPHDPNAEIYPIVEYFSKTDFKKTNKVKPSTELIRS